MTDIWFAADFHLGHRNIIRYCNRPFQNVAEMDSVILDRLNSAVKERDILDFLGDFCIGGTKQAEHYLSQVRCKRIYFVKGNHDKTLRKFQERFVWFKDLAEVRRAVSIGIKEKLRVGDLLVCWKAYHAVFIIRQVHYRLVAHLDLPARCFGSPP